MDSALVNQYLGPILASAPPGASVYDALEAYFTDTIYYEPVAFQRYCYVIIALCGVIFALTACAWVVRFKQGRLHLLLRDGSLTRLDYRTWASLGWSVTAITLATCTAFLTRVYDDKRWTAFVGYFQNMCGVGLMCAADIVLINILASSPRIRKLLIRLSAGSSSSQPFHVPRYRVSASTIIAFATAFLCIASLATIQYPSIWTARAAVHQHESYLEITKIISLARSADNQSLLIGLLPAIQTLQHRSKDAMKAIQVSGCLYSTWLLFWILCGVPAYLRLDWMVRARMRALEAHGNAQETVLAARGPPVASHSINFASASQPRPLEDNDGTNNMTSSYLDLTYTKDELQHEDGKTYTVGLDSPAEPPLTDLKLPIELPKDRPFGNVITIPAASAYPDRYQEVLESKADDSADKIRALRGLLLKDGIEHFLYLCIMLIYLSAYMYNAVNGHTHLEAKQVPVTMWSWLASSFLLPGVFLAAYYLYDAIEPNRISHILQSTKPGFLAPINREQAMANQISTTFELRLSPTKKTREAGSSSALGTGSGSGSGSGSNHSQGRAPGASRDHLGSSTTTAVGRSGPYSQQGHGRTATSSSGGRGGTTTASTTSSSGGRDRSATHNPPQNLAMGIQMSQTLTYVVEESTAADKEADEYLPKWRRKGQLEG